MKIVNNKALYSYLVNSLDDLIEQGKTGSIKQMEIDVFDKITKRSMAIVALQMYELKRAVETNQPLRILESKPFDNTINLPTT